MVTESRLPNPSPIYYSPPPPPSDRRRCLSTATSSLSAPLFRFALLRAHLPLLSSARRRPPIPGPDTPPSHLPAPASPPSTAASSSGGHRSRAPLLRIRPTPPPLPWGSSAPDRADAAPEHCRLLRMSSPPSSSASDRELVSSSATSETGSSSASWSPPPRVVPGLRQPPPPPATAPLLCSATVAPRSGATMFTVGLAPETASSR